MSKIISINNFYSKSFQHELKVGKFKYLAEIEASEEDTPSKVDFRLTGPSVFSREFCRQDEALQHASADGDLSVFAWEVGGGGQRKFIVCSKETFWSFYKKLSRKHYYEVIPWNKPCKLYFDLEFISKHNSGKDGYLMTETLVNIVNKTLQTEFSCQSFLEDVLILESSNNKKFSVHLVFQKAIFPNNGDCGAFVKHLFASLSDEDRKLFEVKDHEDNLTNFIDLSVYSRNRNFRLHLSTKFGKTSQFTVSALDVSSVALLEKSGEFSKKSQDEFEWRIFSNSLITNVGTTDSLISIETGSSQSIRRPRRPVVSRLSPCSSPYPELEQFVTSLVSPGWVRQWRCGPDTDSLVLDIAGTRHCGRVGREHRSNHVYFTCSLSRGVVWQGCHDHQCSGYRGPDIQIPPPVLAWADLADWDQDQDQDQDQNQDLGMKDEDDQFLLEGSDGY